MLKRVTYSLFTVCLGVILLPAFAGAVGPTFLGGNIFTGANNTTDGVWGDPVKANPGNKIDLRLVAQNQTPGTTITNVKVAANFSSVRSTNPQVAATISADNVPAVSDTLTVDIINRTSQSLQFTPGFVTVYSSACPQGCAKSDSLATTGINVGNLATGESVMVVFRGTVTNLSSQVVAETASLSPTPNPTPSPVVPTATPVAATPSVNPSLLPQGGRDEGFTEELPKTGLPETVLLLSGLLPMGVGLKKLGQRGGRGDEETALGLWQKREFSKPTIS